jgi:ferric-dicitrate binding protein FerR (iron transport regulator)
MNRKSPYACALALLASYALAWPQAAISQTAGQRAGEVSRLIPAVSIARGSKNITASPKSVVDWLDLVNTQANARVRIGLDDGSVINVGSEASFRVVKHDAGAQQTELELTYGKLRTQAQKIAKPDGKFEVKTPAGVAGVVGTDFYTAFDNTTQTMNVVVFDGIVKVCNLAGVCVIVKAGQMTGVRGGDNSSPLPPSQAPISVLTAATIDTEVGGAAPPVVTQVHHIGKGTAIGLGILAGIPAVVVPVAVAHTSHGSGASTPIVGCSPNNPKACG